MGTGGGVGGGETFLQKGFPAPFQCNLLVLRQLDQRADGETGAARGTVGDFAGDESGPGDVEMRPASVERDELLEEHGGAARPARPRPGIGEVGGFYQKDSYNNGTSYKQAGEKYTIALGLADGPDFMSRPELRIFASYLNDSEDGKPFEDQTANNTWNFGVQVEAWW